MNPTQLEALRQKTMHYEPGNWGFAEWSLTTLILISTSLGIVTVVNEILANTQLIALK